MLVTDLKYDGDLTLVSLLLEDCFPFTVTFNRLNKKFSAAEKISLPFIIEMCKGIADFYQKDNK